MIEVKALLVEDDVADSEYLQTIVSTAVATLVSFDVVRWLSAALTAIDNREYDVIITDLNLPDSHGIDTAAELVRAAPTVALIVMSGQEDLSTARNAVRAGAQSFVVKSTSLSGRQFERAILQAIDTKNRDNQSKELLFESWYQLSDMAQALPESSLIESPLRAIERAVQELETFLARNSPSGYEACREILDVGGYRQALREIRSLLDIGARRAKGSMRSNAARKLRESSPRTEIKSPADAKDGVAHAILDFDSKIWGQK